MSSSCVPQAEMPPFSKTTILFALRTDAIRWAMMIFVLSGWEFCNAWYRSASVFRSRALVESSKMIISAGFRTALAIEILCFWPPDNVIFFLFAHITWKIQCNKLYINFIALKKPWKLCHIKIDLIPVSYTHLRSSLIFPEGDYPSSGILFLHHSHPHSS